MKERIKYLQNIGRQRQLLKIKNSSLDELAQSLGSETDAKKMYEALRKSHEGYMRIQKVSPSIGEKVAQIKAKQRRISAVPLASAQLTGVEKWVQAKKTQRNAESSACTRSRSPVIVGY